MQGELQFPPSWGGTRAGCGRRKRVSGTAHCDRGKLSRHDPVLVTWKRSRGLGSFRQRAEGGVIVEAIRAARKSGFRIVHFSIQVDHIHFLIEADDRQSLARGMRGLGCRIARGLNKLWRRQGKVFAERFHERILKSLTQVRNALRYVLNNHRKHGHRTRADRPDPFSTGKYFCGWADYPPTLDPRDPDSYVSPPGWKLSIGWRRSHTPIPLFNIPGQATRI